MTGRLGLLFLAAALAACGSSSTPAPAIGLSFPSAVAVFHGYTQKNPTERRPYLAIANAGRGDLNLVDAVDDRPAPAPILLRALQIPALSGPMLLAAGPLADAGADLLAVASEGGSVVQVVETWSPSNRVVLELDLAVDTAGAQILSMVVAPVPEETAPGAGTWQAASGRARLVLGLAGGQLAVLDFTRDPLTGTGEIRLTGRAVQQVGFEAVSLATAPDVVHLYAATPDELPAGSGVYGVAELDGSGVPGAWATAVLPARAPTRLVAAWRLMERTAADSEEFSPTPVDRVYASLDPAGCGSSYPIDCGIAVLDPSPAVRGLLPDPLGEMPHLPPIRVRGEPVALAVAPPPELPPSAATQDKDYGKPYMRVVPLTGARPTTGVMAVPTTEGRVYYVDLARRTVLNDRTMLRPSGGVETRTRADNLSVEGPVGTDQVLLVVVCDELGVCAPSRDPDLILGAIQVTPGYTYDETWRVEYQAVIPGLGLRPAEAGSTGGRLWVAAQQRDVRGTGLVGAARLYDPALGVHAGDVLTVTTSGLAECPASFEAAVDDFAIPDVARYPGGALYFRDAFSVVLDANGANPINTPVPQGCLDRLAAGATGLGLSVRAAGFLLHGASAGYAGRGEVVQPAPDLRVRARLQYENEDTLVCPLSPWPAQPELVTCSGDCRTQCERLALSRKSRRIHNVADSCNSGTDGSDTSCFLIWGALPLPNATGPVLALEIGHRWLDPAAPGAPPSVARNLALVFQTASGIWPTSRTPLSGAPTLPTGVVAFDRSPYVQGDGYRFFVSYLNDFVFDFSPSQTVNVGTSIR